MKKIICSGLIMSLVSMSLMGCATSSKELTAVYTSPMQYQSYDCDQLSSESQRVAGRVNQLGGRLDQASSNDKAIMGVGLILFWPALFALGGTKGQEAEYSRLKGEYDAVQQAAVLKKCPGIVAPSQQAQVDTKIPTTAVSTAQPSVQPITAPTAN